MLRRMCVVCSHTMSSINRPMLAKCVLVSLTALVNVVCVEDSVSQCC